MKRVHLFEFEDKPWFPAALRNCMTRLLLLLHRMLNTKKLVAGLLFEKLKESGETTIVDMCSGSGGPMPDVLKKLREEHGMKDVNLILSDYYPNQKKAEEFNKYPNNHIQFITESVDATNVREDLKGFRTMICSFHHMKPKQARQILENAFNCRQPICIYEISDNSAPLILSWTAFPINIVAAFFLTPFVRPMTWQQIVFTYLIPILPITYAWDGALSNMRTYTLKDMDELLQGLEAEDYTWEKGIKKGKMKNLYLVGMPVK